METTAQKGRLVLQDGAVYAGQICGCPRSVTGEAVFNTGMVGYPEAFTDPSYQGQILVCTYPLIGNYGVPDMQRSDRPLSRLESDRAHIAGLIVSEVSSYANHWDAAMSLPVWLAKEGVPALTGIDTRSLTRHLRSKGTMLGKLLIEDEDLPLHDPNATNLVAQVSVTQPVVYPAGPTRVVVVDCGCKHSIIGSLLTRDVTVLRVPWDYNFFQEDFDGIVISNGPGDPQMCTATIAHLKQAMERSVPLFGICLGHQLLALAAGASTYKLKFGHRSQNQPCIELGTKRCYITSQNHGYAVDSQTLPDGFEPWFINANDGTNEGFRHRSRPFLSVQFHPEAAPGPVDTQDLFDTFLAMLPHTPQP